MSITKQKNIPQVSGFIGTKFFEPDEESKDPEITSKDRLALSMSFCSLGNYDKPIEIREIIGTPDDVQFQKIEYQDLPINDIL